MIAYKHMIEVLKAVKQMSNKIDIPDIDKVLDNIIWLLEIDEKMNKHTNIILMMARMGESKAEQAARNLKLMMSFYKGTGNKVLVNENDILAAIEALDEKIERDKQAKQKEADRRYTQEAVRESLIDKFYELAELNWDSETTISAADTMDTIYRALFIDGENK